MRVTVLVLATLELPHDDALVARRGHDHVGVLVPFKSKISTTKKFRVDSEGNGQNNHPDTRMLYFLQQGDKTVVLHRKSWCLHKWKVLLQGYGSSVLRSVMLRVSDVDRQALPRRKARAWLVHTWKRYQAGMNRTGYTGVYETREEHSSRQR